MTLIFFVSLEKINYLYKYTGEKSFYTNINFKCCVIYLKRHAANKNEYIWIC